MYQITPTQFFYPLSVLYHESGLEVTPARKPPKEPWPCGGAMIWRTVPSWEPPPYRCVQDTTFWPIWPWQRPPGDRGWGRNCWRWQRPRPSVWGAKELWLVGRYRTFTVNSTGWKSPGKMPLPSPNASPVTSSRWTVSPALCAKCCPDKSPEKRAVPHFLRNGSLPSNRIFVFRPLACTLTGASCGPGVGPG